MIRTRFILLTIGVAVLGALIGCGAPYTSLTDYPGQARLSVWPENYDDVARNAAVWVEITPSYADVTGFEIVEVYGGRRYSVPFTSTRKQYSNEYLFCPTQNLSPYTRYEVWLEIDYRDEFEWRFDTTGSYAGNPSDCYYARGWDDGASVKSAAIKVGSEDGWEAYNLRTK